MLPDRVSNPGSLTYESGAPTDCATRPGRERERDRHNDVYSARRNLIDF